MSCAWAKIAQPQPVNLQNIISEDWAKARESKRHDDYLGKQENESLDHETENVNDSVVINSVHWDATGIDDSFEEIDWVKFEQILIEYDPIPNREISGNDVMLYKKKHQICLDYIVPPTPDERNNTDIHNCKIKANPYSYYFFNEYTKRLLSKLFNKNIIKSINGILNVGTKSIILHGTTFNGEECIIKVFQRSTQMEYENSKAFRKTLEDLAQQEMNILLRLDKIGVRAPKFITLQGFIVVMSFIGGNKVSAPTLETAALTAKKYKKAYTQTIEGMKKSYAEEKIIHGDLSEQNILWYNNRCHFIDVCESVVLNNNDDFYDLQRSCEKVIEFFKGKKVTHITTADRLFNTIRKSYRTQTMREPKN